MNIATNQHCPKKSRSAGLGVKQAGVKQFGAKPPSGLSSSGIHHVLLFVITTLLFISCEKETDWDFDALPPNTIVVDALLTNEFKTHQITLNYPVAKMNDKPLPVINAQVMVNWQTRIITFTESASNPGVYLSDQPFAPGINRRYLLRIKKDTVELAAQSYMIPVLPYVKPSFNVERSNGRYSLRWNNAQFSPREEAMYEAIIHWDHIPGYNHPDSLSKAKLQFFTFNTIDVSYNIFPQNYEELEFPEGSIAYISKYSLNPEHGAYMRALLSETQWQGSLFETARGNLSGNITNGLGYFATSAVIRDTIVVGR
jgi:hypothetical protein